MSETPEITDEVRRDAKVLWDYHDVGASPRPADVVVALGSHDLRVADAAADLILRGLAPVLIVTGGAGKVTGEIWKRSEAVLYAERALARGVPESSIVIEEDSTNTGDNIVFARNRANALGLRVSSGLLVSKPYMKRRALLTARIAWPEADWTPLAPEIGFEDYPSVETPERRMINLLVGDTQRIWLFAERGFQAPDEVPEAVHAAYSRLANAGFSEFVLPEND